MAFWVASTASIAVPVPPLLVFWVVTKRVLQVRPCCREGHFYDSGRSRTAAEPNPTPCSPPSRVCPTRWPGTCSRSGRPKPTSRRRRPLLAMERCCRSSTASFRCRLILDKLCTTPHYFFTRRTFFTRAPVFRGGTLPRAAFCTRAATAAPHSCNSQSSKTQECCAICSSSFSCL